MINVYPAVLNATVYKYLSRKRNNIWARAIQCSCAVDTSCDMKESTGVRAVSGRPSFREWKPPQVF